MLYVISRPTAKDVIRQALSGLSPIAPVILRQDGVYLYHWLTEQYPALNVKALTPDILARGLVIPTTHQLSIADWAKLSSTHYPWISLA